MQVPTGHVRFFTARSSGFAGDPVDRGLAGVLLICLVASTTVAWLFLGLKPPEKVTVIRFEAFEEELEKAKSYSLELLVRQPVKHLTVEFSYLVRVNKKTHEALQSLLDSEGLLKLSQEALLAMPKVEEIQAMMQLFPQRPAVHFFTDHAVYTDRLRTVEYDVAILDLHEFFRYLPANAGPDVFTSYTVFAALFHGDNVSFYEGARDYYLNRRVSIGEILYEAGEESHLFENRNVMVPRTSDYVDIAEAPPFGTLSFEDLEAGESVRFHFTTRYLAGPGILIARVLADGAEDKVIYKFLGWPEQAY